MARELEALKNQRGDEGVLKSTPSSMTDEPFRSPEQPSNISFRPVFDESGLDLENFQLGAFVIDKSMVVDSFKLFASLFYPHFPIFESSVTIGSIHQASPFLFWTIIAIVMSHATRSIHDDLWSLMKEPYVATLKSEILKAPIPLDTIQAISYLIMWPLPSIRQIQDPTWLYCGVAVNAALYMGIHSPKPARSLRGIGVKPGSMQARSNTWLGCFLSSASLSIFLGLSPLIDSTTDLNTIEKFVREPSVQREFAYQVMVHHTLAKFTNILANDTNGPINHSLVELIDGELDALQTRFPTDWTPRTEFNVLVAKLQLYTMTIVRTQSDPASHDVLLKLGFSAALRIVYLSKESLPYVSDEHNDLNPAWLQRSLPKNYFRSLILAAIFLLRYFALNSRATAQERELARNHVIIVHAYFKEGATNDTRDERLRAAALLEHLGQQQAVDIENAKLRIDNRLGASLLFDAISESAELRNKSGEARETIPDIVSHPQKNSFDTATNGIQLSVGLENKMVEEYEPLDFSLPQDIWGDSLWDMFDFGIAPSQQ
ncbi:uncharacterized protein BDR25DRAFT_215847 [Lindgomyces ingoldianus]|uniref:Uncharacterized protein n=1 Tax=Lindgomyces ingoldianus TaxID=673940 RepID=A0ACB6R526_9PLEO|nr:uncharacterized protein BDR25DRAFT_215847 [Lindgomyces ingoldianus]KAF2474393.1 hypothetical protein BDR25DRAFT_215847 [Lindgomyces ingoldianus]